MLPSLSIELFELYCTQSVIAPAVSYIPDVYIRMGALEMEPTDEYMGAEEVKVSIEITYIIFDTNVS